MPLETMNYFKLVTYFCILSVGNFQYHLNHNVIRNEYTLPTIREQPENSTVTFKDLHFSVLRQTGEADPFQTLKLADRCFQINSLTNYAQSSCQLFIKKNCTEKQ